MRFIAHAQAWLPAALTAVLTLAALSVLEVGLRQQALDDAMQSTRRMADLYAHRIALSIAQSDDEVRALARMASLGALDDESLRSGLALWRQLSPNVLRAAALDEHGQVRAATDRAMEGRSMAQRPEFGRARDEPWMSDVHAVVELDMGPPARSGDALDVIDFSAPVRSPGGESLGVVTARVDWSGARSLWRQALQAAPRMQLSLLSHEGRTLLGVATPNPRQRQGPSGDDRIKDDGGKTWLASYTRVAQGPAAALDWTVVAALRESDVLQPLRSAQSHLALGGTSVCLILLAIGWWRVRRHGSPYDGLLSHTLRMPSHAESPEAWTGQIDAVARELRQWPIRARAKFRGATPDTLYAALAIEGQRLKQLLDQCPLPLCVVGEDHRLRYWNAACEALYGWRADEAVGRLPQELLAVESGTCNAEATFRRWSDEPAVMRLPVTRKGGDEVWVECRTMPLREPDGRRGGFMSVMRDLSDERRAEAHARDTEQRLAVLVEAAVDLVLMRLDATGLVTQWSMSAEGLFGIPAARMIDRSIEVVFPFDEVDAGIPESLIRRADAVGRVEHEGYLLRNGTERFWANLLVYRLEGASDSPAGFAVVARDLSERRATEERLQQSEATLSAIIDNASDAVISTDVLGRVQLFNPAAERTFGIAAIDMVGRTLDRLIPMRSRTAHEVHIARFATSVVASRPMGRRGKLLGVRADGSEVHLEASISQTVVHSQKVLTAILRDVSDRVKAEDALLEHQRQLTALTQRLMSTEQETNRRLAQVLHDQLGQTLTAMRLAFDALQASMRRDPPTPNESLHQRLSELIDRSVREVRQVLVDLRPALLQELGLSAAIDNEVRNQSKEAPDMQLVFEPDPRIQRRRWRPSVEFAVFMIAREALGNAIRHAGASEVHVVLSQGPCEDLLVLTVQDNGSGIGEDAHVVKPGHLGLVGMRERAVAIGGRLHVESSPQHGTTITLEWRDDT